MNERDRLRAAMLGQEVDRPPIWLREGFDFTKPPAEADHPWLGWQAEPHYRELWEFAREHCAMKIKWNPGGALHRLYMIPPERIQVDKQPRPEGGIRNTYTLKTPRGDLTVVEDRTPGVNTNWHVKEAADSIEEMEMLRAVPFEIGELDMEAYTRADKAAGTIGMPRTSVSSPIVVISNCCGLENTLLWTATEPNWIHEMLQELTERTIAVIEAAFADGPLDTIVNVGGAEQCTPPMMRPEAYAEFVTPYEGEILKALRRNGVPIASCHCHGRVKSALPEMVKMGFDASDPVEPPPGGDLSIAEAREIVGDQLTLIGNYEFDELEYAEPDHIRRRAREILAVGPRRLVVSSSTGPISALSEKAAANFRTWIETVVETSGID